MDDLEEEGFSENIQNFIKRELMMMRYNLHSAYCKCGWPSKNTKS